MAYTTSTLIGNYLQRTLTADETAFLVVLIPAIKTWLDLKLSSTFDSAAETTRYYDGGESVVDIDPCQSITAVSFYDNDTADGTSDDNYTDLADYVAEPVNETIKRQLVKRSGIFSRGSRRVAVTAKFTEYDFTNSKVPDDIQALATAMAAAIINVGVIASSGGNVASESLEGHSIQYDTSASAMEDISESNNVIKGILQMRRDMFVG